MGDYLDILNVEDARGLKRIGKFGMALAAIFTGSGGVYTYLELLDDFKRYLAYHAGELQLTEREITTLTCNNKIAMYGEVFISLLLVYLFRISYKAYKEGKEAEEHWTKG